MSNRIGCLRQGLNQGVAALALSVLAPTVGCSIAPTPPPAEAAAQRAVVANGFQENEQLHGHANPIGVRFVKAPGPLRAFVFEKSGKVYYYADFAHQSSPAQATLVADLSSVTHEFWDRGLLGLAIHPDFPATPELYVLTTFDPGGFWMDTCSDPTGAGCVVSGRLSRLTLNFSNLGVASTLEQPLLEAKWCMQYPSHATGDLHFGSDGYLYASSGDGASFNFLDWGQADGLVHGVPTKNACSDPGALDAQGRLLLASSEGGQLRSQDVQSNGDPIGYDGTILRMDVSGALPVAPASNPLVGKGNADDDFIIATGFRNPYRFNIRPGTNEVWVADVGENVVEEIDRIQDPTGALENFGWPCLEGPNSRFAGNDLCNRVKAQTFAPAVSPQALLAPYFSYRHDQVVAAGDNCGTGGSSITAIAFNDKSTYAAPFAGALFFADSTRRCVWSMKLGADGQPDPATRAVLIQGSGRAVDLQMANDGRLYYVDHDGGRVVRIDGFGGNQPPQAVITASPSNGPAPLSVQFSAAQSTDAEGDALSFAWDMDADGAYDDAQGVAPQYTFSVPGTVPVSVLVSDTAGHSSAAEIMISVDNTAPVPAIALPTLPATWAAGDVIQFAGTGFDAEDGELAPSALSWRVVIRHCGAEPIPGQPEDCHSHPIQSFSGASGSFVAPDHTYYSYLQLFLTATDSGGLSTTSMVRLEPRPVRVQVSSVPAGVAVSIGGRTPQAAPTDSVKVLQNGQTTLQVASPQTIGNRLYTFASWSNGGLQTQTIQPTSDQALSVLFQDAGPVPLCVTNPLTVVASAASSIEDATTPASGAFDGVNPGVCGAGPNRWASQFADPQWLYADLGANRHLGEVVLYWECAYSSNFDLQVAPDEADPNNAAAYVTVFNSVTNAAGKQTIPNLNASARYVRIYSRARATQWGNSLYEVEVKGDPNPNCRTTPLCGDAVCSAGETCSNCAADCGACNLGRNIAENLQAETYDGMAGLLYETTTDTGGGQNAGWIANGDYVEWRIFVPTAGSYSVTTRSATWNPTSLQVRVDNVLTSTLSLPKTGNGTQTWGSFTTNTFNMTAGTHLLRVTFTGLDQNLNWIKVNAAPPVQNLLTNGSFNSDVSSWVGYFYNPAGKATFENGAARVTLTQGGTDWWAQLYQTKTVAAGNYRLTANAQTLAGNKTIALFCEQDGGAYTGYGQANCAITPAWNAGVGCSVTCNNVPAGVPIKFGVKGGLDLTSFRIDNFVLSKL